MTPEEFNTALGNIAHQFESALMDASRLTLRDGRLFSDQSAKLTASSDEFLTNLRTTYHAKMAPEEIRFAGIRRDLEATFEDAILKLHHVSRLDDSPVRTPTAPLPSVVRDALNNLEKLYFKKD